MRVITEERLKELFGSIIYDGHEYDGKRILWGLIKNECKELDQLTVTKLRPMSEAHHLEDEEFLVKFKGKDDLKFVCIFQGQMIDQYCDWVDPSRCEGWTPIPIYQPE